MCIGPSGCDLSLRARPAGAFGSVSGVRAGRPRCPQREGPDQRGDDSYGGNVGDFPQSKGTPGAHHVEPVRPTRSDVEMVQPPGEPVEGHEDDRQRDEWSQRDAALTSRTAGGAGTAASNAASGLMFLWTQRENN